METNFTPWNDQLEIEADMRADVDADEMLARDPFWTCDHCKAQNSRLDGECQFCEFDSQEDVAEYEEWLDGGDMDGDHGSALESVYGPND